MVGSQIQLRRWLNEGEVIAPTDGESINLYGKWSYSSMPDKLVAPSRDDPIVAPAALDLAESMFNGSAKCIRES